MDWIVENITVLVQYGLPVLPYLIISLLTHQLMSRLVSPTIRSHRVSADTYDSKKWKIIRKYMVLYPMILGGLMALPFGLNIGYSIGAGAAAQYAYHLIKEFLKKYDIELPGDNSLPPEAS